MFCTEILADDAIINDCLVPQSPPVNGIMQCTSGKYRARICRFSCEQSYSLLGSSIVRCVADNNGRRTWDGEFPRCIGKKVWREEFIQQRYKLLLIPLHHFHDTLYI